MLEQDLFWLITKTDKFEVASFKITNYKISSQHKIEVSLQKPATSLKIASIVSLEFAKQKFSGMVIAIEAIDLVEQRITIIPHVAALMSVVSKQVYDNLNLSDLLRQLFGSYKLIENIDFKIAISNNTKKWYFQNLEAGTEFLARLCDTENLYFKYSDSFIYITDDYNKLIQNSNHQELAINCGGFTKEKNIIAVIENYNAQFAKRSADQASNNFFTLQLETTKFYKLGVKIKLDDYPSMYVTGIDVIAFNKQNVLKTKLQFKVVLHKTLDIIAKHQAVAIPNSYHAAKIFSNAIDDNGKYLAKLHGVTQTPRRKLRSSVFNSSGVFLPFRENCEIISAFIDNASPIIMGTLFNNQATTPTKKYEACLETIATAKIKLKQTSLLVAAPDEAQKLALSDKLALLQAQKGSLVINSKDDFTLKCEKYLQQADNSQTYNLAENFCLNSAYITINAKKISLKSSSEIFLEACNQDFYAKNKIKIDVKYLSTAGRAEFSAKDVSWQSHVGKIYFKAARELSLVVASSEVTINNDSIILKANTINLDAPGIYVLDNNNF